MEEEQNNRAFSEIVRDYERALGDPQRVHFDETVEMVDAINRNCSGVGLLQGGNKVALVEHWYTRLAAAITHWATRPETALNAEKLEKIIRRKNEFVYIFSASGYRNMGHLIPLLNSRDEDDQFTIDGKKIILLLALLGIDDLSDELLGLAFRLDKQILMHLMLGWLNQRAVLSEEGERMRGVLLTSGHSIAGARITDPDIGLIVNAYMYSSYASHPDKHSIKATFNELLIQKMADAGVIARSAKRKITARPTVLIIHERFRNKHAMFRSYAPMIRGMRSKFAVVALAETDFIDKPAEELFERVYKIDSSEQKNLKNIAKIVTDIAPDIIYYPSLGMCHWTVMLSNLRLAPVQIMSQGHPATSKSKEIDYVFVSAMEGDPTVLHSEKILMGEAGVVFAKHSELPEQLPSIVEPSDREVRVAVNSKVMKLSYRLLDICRRLRDAASVPVKFHFFPGEIGWYADGISALIKAHIPDALVSPYQEYNSFLAEIAKCDMALAAFPFGNTNSTVDTCVLGVPTVANFGPETPAQTDKMVLKAAGYPELLVCNGDTNYFETALRLIEEPDLRRSITQNINRNDVIRRLAPADGEDTVEELAEMLWWAYQNHEHLIAGDSRLIRISECRAT